MLDCQTDSSLQALHTLSKQFLGGELPEFVKAGETVPERLPSTAYGDPLARQFPLHTKGATYLAHLYFFGQGANHEKSASNYPASDTVDRLSNAAHFWQIVPQVNSLLSSIQEKCAEQVPETVKDSDYALAATYQGEEIRRYPMVNSASVIKAASDFQRDSVNYPYAWRRKTATNILKKAMELDARPAAHVTDYLVRAAGMYPSPVENIADDMILRSHVLPEKYKQPLRKMAAHLVAGTGDRIKACELLDSADRESGSYSLYDTGMPMPEELMFTGVPSSVKQASVDTVKLTSGSEYSIENLKSAGIEPFTILDDAYVSDLMAPDQVNLDTAKIAQVLPTMPRDDAQRLDKSLHAVGVQPLTKSASRTADDWLDEDAWRRFATTAGPESAKDFGMTIALDHDQATHKA